MKLRKCAIRLSIHNHVILMSYVLHYLKQPFKTLESRFLNDYLKSYNVLLTKY